MSNVKIHPHEAVVAKRFLTVFGLGLVLTAGTGMILGSAKTDPMDNLLVMETEVGLVTFAGAALKHGRTGDKLRRSYDVMDDEGIMHNTYNKVNRVRNFIMDPIHHGNTFFMPQFTAVGGGLVGAGLSIHTAIGNHLAETGAAAIVITLGSQLYNDFQTRADLDWLSRPKTNEAQALTA